MNAIGRNILSYFLSRTDPIAYFDASAVAVVSLFASKGAITGVNECASFNF